MAESESIPYDNDKKTQGVSTDHPEEPICDAVSPGAKANNRGYVAWLKVLGSFIIFFNTWGVLLAFGGFQTYYEQVLLKDDSSSSIAWIGTTFAFLLLLGGATTGKFFDLGYTRVLLVVGSFLVVFGLMMTSLSTKYYEVFLSQAIVVGLGTSMLYVPALTIVALAFEKHMRGIALGLVSSGTSVGGVVYPIMFRSLETQIGFPWTVRVIAFTVLGTLIISLVILLPLEPHRSPKARKLLDKTALTDLPFMLYVLSGIFSGIGYYTPLVFLPSFVESSIHGLHDATDIAFYALAIANGSTFVSRIGAGFVAARFGPLRTYTLALLFSGVILLAWIAVSSLAGLIVWTVMLGIVTGMIISLPGAIVPQLCPNLDLLGTRIGMSFVGTAIGILIGGPIGGKLIYSISPTTATWWPLQVFTGLSMLVAFMINIYPWTCVHRR